MLTVAIVGCGAIGNTHARQYAAISGCQLVAVGDIRQDDVDATARRFHVIASTDLGQMLAAEEIDAVSVCTAGVDNGGNHYAVARQCPEAGKHVLVEKPICNALEPAKEPVRLARERGLFSGRGPQPPLRPCRKEGADPGTGGADWRAGPVHHGTLDRPSERVLSPLPPPGAAQPQHQADDLVQLYHRHGVRVGMSGGPCSARTRPRHATASSGSSFWAMPVASCWTTCSSGWKLFPHGSDDTIAYRATMMNAGPHVFVDTFGNRRRGWRRSARGAGEGIGGGGLAGAGGDRSSDPFLPGAEDRGYGRTAGK